MARMYTVDDRDRVTELSDVPQSSVGAPCPLILASEQESLVAYFVQESPAAWDGKSVRVVATDSLGEPAALVRFLRMRATMFGPPNDEAFSGHPLAERGLHPYGAFEITESSWIRQLERMNAVHPCHRPEVFSTHRHFVLAFHDSTFECVANSYALELSTGPLTELVARAARGLRG
jgi:hypothetical protein